MLGRSKGGPLGCLFKVQYYYQHVMKTNPGAAAESVLTPWSNFVDSFTVSDNLFWHFFNEFFN